MEYRIILTNEANYMLKEHANFLNRVSIKATVKLKMLIKDSLTILKYFPRIGHKIKENKKSSTNYRKLVMNKRYILIYYIYQKKIYIQTILDCRQSNEKYLY